MSCKSQWARAATLMVSAALCLVRTHALDVVVSVQSVSCAPGETSTAWISVENATGITGGDFSLRLPEFAVPSAAKLADTSAGFLIASRPQRGHIEIAIASTAGLSANQGPILAVPFTVDRAATPGLYALTFDRLEVYDNAPAPAPSRTLSGLLAVTPPAPDRDADGLPDDWEIAFFGNREGSAAADPDQDGTSNAVEFLAGTDPTRADSVFAVAPVRLDSPEGGVGLYWQAAENRSYTIEWSDDPLGSDMNWHEVYHPEIQQDAAGAQWIDDGSRTYRLPSEANQRYYRVRIDQP